MEDNIEFINANNSNNESKNIFKKYLIIGFGIGVLIAGGNFATLGFVGSGYFIMFPLLGSFFSLFFPCSGEGCWGAMIMAGSIVILITTPFILFFIRYIADAKNYPYTRKKIVIVFTVVGLMLLQQGIYYLEKSANTYAYEVVHAKSQNKTYFSLSECKRTQPYEITGDCYGYFASLKNDINLCDEYLKDFNVNLDKDYTLAECITSFSVNKSDINLCNQIKGSKRELYSEKCKARYHIAKSEYDKCNTVSNSSWKDECLKNTKNIKVNPFVKKYAEMRGFIDKYQKYENASNRL